jgi:hypothetical protein
MQGLGPIFVPEQHIDRLQQLSKAAWMDIAWLLAFDYVDGNEQAACEHLLKRAKEWRRERRSCAQDLRQQRDAWIRYRQHRAGVGLRLVNMEDER